MSIKRWSQSIVPVTLLLAGTAYADPAAAPTKPPESPAAAPQADQPQLRRTLGAQAATEGKQGGKPDPQAPAAAPARADRAPGYGERGNGVAPEARAYGERGNGVAAGDRGPGGPGHEGHDHGPGHSDAPPRAAVQALMKAQSLSEEQAIVHLRAQGVQADHLAAVEADARRARRDELRRERAKELRGRLKARGIPNQLRVELRTHAKRIAQIERIRTLAGADAKLITRIDATLVRENERHTRRMTRLVDDANQAPAEGVAPAAVPAEAPPAAAAPAAPPAADKIAAPAAEPQKATEQGVTP